MLMGDTIYHTHKSLQNPKSIAISLLACISFIMAITQLGYIFKYLTEWNPNDSHSIDRMILDVLDSEGVGPEAQSEVGGYQSNMYVFLNTNLDSPLGAALILNVLSTINVTLLSLIFFVGLLQACQKEQGNETSRLPFHQPLFTEPLLTEANASEAIEDYCQLDPEKKSYPEADVTEKAMRGAVKLLEQQTDESAKLVKAKLESYLLLLESVNQLDRQSPDFATKRQELMQELIQALTTAEGAFKKIQNPPELLARFYQKLVAWNLKYQRELYAASKAVYFAYPNEGGAFGQPAVDLQPKPSVEPA